MADKQSRGGQEEERAVRMEGAGQGRVKGFWREASESAVLGGEPLWTSATSVPPVQHR